MTNEEIIKLILESQSRQEANLERMQAQLDQTGTLITNLTQTTFNVIGVLAGRINDLVDQGHRTDERISAVVNMVEKWIAENQKRRNGDR